jgi:hypothetical protein
VLPRKIYVLTPPVAGGFFRGLAQFIKFENFYLYGVHGRPLSVFTGFCAALFNQASRFGFVGDVFALYHFSEGLGGLAASLKIVPCLDVVVFSVFHGAVSCNASRICATAAATACGL